MFFGDPYKFAIQCDIVSEWNDDYFWINGIFNIYIEGNSVINELYTSELRFTLANITDDILGSMTQTDNINLVDNISSKQRKLLSISSPEMEDNSIFVYFLFSKDNDYIFLEKDGDELNFKYEKGYIMKILLSVLDWKKRSFTKGKN
ncbi:Imm42 family immunity protein [Histophilus somni]|uniref:Uncharacterized protein n=1 Tax=Histophilus somni TaxID=731 RepID=A0AAX2S0A4_HISSO|nr:Imm42 family immunity protein [Histophilus somni]ACA31408.1 hypothetical protein HSM_1640 [Histophilus somni 2336]TDF36121.1 hypothetical protein E1290_08955 [Histophilus somni]TEW26229.1 hypothetical protein E2R48_10440 [Histophilus somni]TFF00591.1 hypothetical protein E3U35_10560 [Histophilus somni]THA20690.1 hypothetical protein E5361_09875 [Histophilus somni]